MESEIEQLKMAIDAITKAKVHITAERVHVDKLEAIALARFGLALTATWMERLYVQEQRCNYKTEVRRMFDVAETLCNELPLRWPGYENTNAYQICVYKHNTNALQ